MKPRLLDKDHILIYPFDQIKSPVSINTSKAKRRNRSSKYKDLLENLSKIEISTPFDPYIESHRTPLNIGSESLSTIKSCKSLSPKHCVDWLDQFIVSINTVDQRKSKQLEEIEKHNILVRSSISELLKSVNHLRSKKIV